jgi:uncharacterized protein (DUF2062 family)
MRKYKDKVVGTLLTFLTQGLTPEKLSLTIALGITLGILPIIGPTTGLCILAAFIFRLNQAALQLINYISYPFQILCLIPFYNLGALFFRDTNFTLGFHELKEKFSHNLLDALVELWSATWHAAVAWLIISPFLVILIYRVSYPIIRTIILKRKITHEK